MHRPKARLTVLAGVILVGVVGLLLLAAPKISAFLEYFPDFCYPYRNTTDVTDLNGDGDLDLIVHGVCLESESIMFHWTALWINQGSGRFSVRGVEFPPYLFYATAATDVDRDGDADLLALDAESLMLFLNQGGAQGGENGVFKINNPVMAPERVWQYGSTVLGDLNGDLEPDGFVAGCCGKQRPGALAGEDAASISWVWINEWDPRGWLVRHSLSLKELDGVPIWASALGDLDGDGDLDVYAATGTPTDGVDGGPADRVLINDGTGRFTDSGQRLGDINSRSVALGDADGDGDPDALVGATNGTVVWINQGGVQGGLAGTYAGPRRVSTGGLTSAVFLQDLNGDDASDVVVAGAEQATVWWNDGSGNYAASDQRFRYSKSHGVAVADFDADGRADIMAADGRRYQVWFNRGDGGFGARP